MATKRAAQRDAQESTSDPRPARTRAAIVEAYAAALSDTGYLRLSVSGLIREAGVSRSAFYHHFSSLDAVASALVEQLIEGLADAERKQRTVEHVPGRQAARGSVAALADHVNANPELYRHLLKDPASGGVRGDFARGLVGGTARSIETARPDFLPHEVLLAAQVLAGGFAHGLLHWLESVPRVSTSEFVESMLCLFPEWLVSPGDRERR